MIAIMIGDPSSNAGMSTGTFIPSICLHWSVEFGTRHKNGNKAIIYGPCYSNRFNAFNQLSMPTKVTIRNARTERARVGTAVLPLRRRDLLGSSSSSCKCSGGGGGSIRPSALLVTRGPGESFFSVTQHTHTHATVGRKMTHS